MPGKYSREKGLRGERDIVHRLGPSAKRVGVSYLQNPVDVETSYARYQIKNKSLGGGALLEAIEKMERSCDKSKSFYVIFKPLKGRWLAVETLDQLQAEHGEFPVKK